MADERIERWRNDLASSDVLTVINAVAQVAGSKLPEGLELLRMGGANLQAEQWDMTIDLRGDSVDLRTWFAHEQQRLEASVPSAAQVLSQTRDRVFISYSTTDRDRATRLALAIDAEPGATVFLDRWELGTNDRLADRLRQEAADSDAMVLLLSAASAASEWVREEIATALQSGSRVGPLRLVIVRLDDCELLPELEPLRDLIHVDWRSEKDTAQVVQSVLDELRGQPSFAARLSELLRAPTEDAAARQARDAIVDLNPGDLWHVERNQHWLLWNLFHEVIPRYPVSLVVGSNKADTTVSVALVDRWNRTRNTVSLTEESLHAGLWRVGLDLRTSTDHDETSTRFLGDLGRLSFRKKPHESDNRAVPTDFDSLQNEWSKLQRVAGGLSHNVAVEFLDLLQLAVGPSTWRTIDVVLGGVFVDVTFAISHMFHAPDALSGPGLLVELWDPFFGSLHTSQLLETQLTHEWGQDLDLYRSSIDFTLGAA